MARVENTSERQYDIHIKDHGFFQIPRSDDAGGTKKRVNGVGEIPDAALKAALASDDWTKAVFASGDLVVVKGDAKPEADKK